MQQQAFVKFEKELFVFGCLFLAIGFMLATIINGGAYAKELYYGVFADNALSLAADPIFSFTSSGVDSTLAPPGSRPEGIMGFYHRGAFRLIVPNINVNAPLVHPESDTTKDILAGLEKGVVLYPGSAMPGERGRIVILGHSSLASWYRGSYATVFAPLNHLKPGDTFVIADGNKKHIYEVFDKKTLTPAATNEFLAGPHEFSEVDLITCYPVGSASRRKIIRARLMMTQPL